MPFTCSSPETHTSQLTCSECNEWQCKKCRFAPRQKTALRSICKDCIATKQEQGCQYCSSSEYPLTICWGIYSAPFEWHAGCCELLCEKCATNCNFCNVSVCGKCCTGVTNCEDCLKTCIIGISSAHKQYKCAAVYECSSCATNYCQSCRKGIPIQDNNYNYLQCSTCNQRSITRGKKTAANSFPTPDAEQDPSKDYFNSLSRRVSRRGSNHVGVLVTHKEEQRTKIADPGNGQSCNLM